MTYAIRVAGSERVFERAPARKPRAGARRLCPGHPSHTAAPIRMARLRAGEKRDSLIHLTFVMQTRAGRADAARMYLGRSGFRNRGGAACY